MKTVYKTRGTCSQFIEVEAEDGRITACRIIGGCDGNTKGLSKLVVGMRMEDVLERLNGIRCGMKPTSCPDQLCRAIEQMQREAARQA
ncbi:MAG: TIGR03905 family TSCPD domain-containing protein [Prevotellaceae bacterium]|nr:TIGR03905 family TSCPD domain-containing protein [Prevotellaceae bacterium]MCD8285544.1 TIGR03905 family TSCPD domain-containing protein [Prevotellaceae bacterium]MCD8304228.1 TIGR03905 family TSCPD domain-containing protein [Prevotellaceae bacterium]